MTQITGLELFSDSFKERIKEILELEVDWNYKDDKPADIVLLQKTIDWLNKIRELFGEDYKEPSICIKGYDGAPAVEWCSKENNNEIHFDLTEEKCDIGYWIERNDIRKHYSRAVVLEKGLVNLIALYCEFVNESYKT